MIILRKSFLTVLFVLPSLGMQKEGFLPKGYGERVYEMRQLFETQKNTKEYKINFEKEILKYEKEVKKWEEIKTKAENEKKEFKQDGKKKLENSQNNLKKSNFALNELEKEEKEKQNDLEDKSFYIFEDHVNMVKKSTNLTLYAQLKFTNDFYKKIKETFKLEGVMINSEDFHAALPSIYNDREKIQLEALMGVFCACDIVPYRVQILHQSEKRNKGGNGGYQTEESNKSSLNIFFKYADYKDNYLELDKGEFHLDILNKNDISLEDLKQNEKYIAKVIKDMKDKNTIKDLSVKGNIAFAQTRNKNNLIIIYPFV